MKYAELTKTKKQISELIPNARNPRNHPEKQVEQLQGSVKTYKYSKGSIVVQSGTNKVLAGHGMLTALKAEGFTEVDVIEADLSDDLADAFMVADNRFGELSEWDFGNLDEILKELDGKGIPIDYMGFDDKSLQELCNSIGGGYQADEKDDDVPEVKEAITQKGDIWYLGNHKVMAGDSTCKDDVDRLMEDNEAELLFTSPPYSDMRDYGGNIDLSINHLIEFISCFSSYANYQVINLGIKRVDNEIDQYWNEYISKAKDEGYKLLSWNVWVKPNASSIGQQTAMFPINSEFIFVFGENRKDLHRTITTKTGGLLNKNYIRNKDGSHNSDGFHIRNTKTFIPQAIQITQEGNPFGDHPATFPVLLPYGYIEAMTGIDDIVVDCFGGSGTSLIAAEKLNRQSFLMELSPSYCDVIVKRYIDFVGSDKDVFVDRQGQKIAFSEVASK